MNIFGIEIDTRCMLAEDYYHFGNCKGDELVEQAQRLWYCKPDLEDHQSVDDWLAAGGEIIQL